MCSAMPLRIAVIGSYDSSGSGAGSLRTQGFTAALAEAGIEHDPKRTGETLVWTRSTGAEAMNRLLDAGTEVDAVFGLNDVLALGAMRVLFERGIRVPDDVAVAGFDDIEEGRFSCPSLTTVQPGRAEIARTAVWLLVDRIARGEPRGSGGKELVVGPELVVRESTGFD
jgi:DNA-binding LacI/PurR family transcriptional regulator